jgi:hypothetical protein
MREGTQQGRKPPPSKPTTALNCHQIAADETPSWSFSSWLTGEQTVESMTFDWAVGIGPTNTDFGPNSVQSQQIISAYGLGQNASNFLAGGASSGIQNFGLGGLVSSGLNPTTQFCGVIPMENVPQWQESQHCDNEFDDCMVVFLPYSPLQS